VLDDDEDGEDSWDDVLADMEDPWMREPAPLSALQEMLQLEAAATYGGGPSSSSEAQAGAGGGGGGASSAPAVPAHFDGSTASAVQPLALAELRRLQQERGQALALLDVRSAEEFAAGCGLRRLPSSLHWCRCRGCAH
jgi:hypothetical protein